jgi:methionyl-tRNA synthetase
LVNYKTSDNTKRNRHDDIDSGDIEVPAKYITAPIYYVNGEPHLGHLYTSVAVDILARFEKINGNRVFTSFGTDEHGQKVENAGSSFPSIQEYVDKMSLNFRKMLDASSVEYNVFIKTTSDIHKKTAQYLWNKIYDSGLIYEGSYAGWYSKRDEAFYKESDVQDGKSTETGSPVEWIEESCLFFALSKMKAKLIEHYSNNPDSIKPKAKYNEVIGMLKSDIPDLAISRSRFSWGIPVPGHEGQIMYVWIDALANYLTTIGYPKNTEYSKWWDNVVHIIGKDILKFHAVYWPAFLLAADIKPPHRIFAHGWWNVGHEKMSKSLGNVVDPFKLIEKYGVDEVRYFLFREVHFGNDGSFSDESIHHMINTELSNELGNLVQRVLMFCYNKFGSTIKCGLPHEDILQEWDNALADSIEFMQNQDISGYTNRLRSAIIETNKYIDTKKPWSEESEVQKQILGVLCLCIQRLLILSWPIIHNKSKSALHMIGVNDVLIEKSWHANQDFPLKKPEAMFMRRS